MAEAKHPIRQIIADDKQTAGEVIDAASRELREGMIFLGEDITGTPTVARSFNRWKERHQQVLQGGRDATNSARRRRTPQVPHH
jgi:hypothetical protein